MTCDNCKREVAALKNWGGTHDGVSLARNPWLVKQWCRFCVVRAQVEYARPIAAGLSKLEAELALLQAVVNAESAVRP